MVYAQGVVGVDHGGKIYLYKLCHLDDYDRVVACVCLYSFFIARKRGENLQACGALVVASGFLSFGGTRQKELICKIAGYFYSKPCKLYRCGRADGGDATKYAYRR